MFFNVIRIPGAIGLSLSRQTLDGEGETRAYLIYRDSRAHHAQKHRFTLLLVWTLTRVRYSRLSCGIC